MSGDALRHLPEEMGELQNLERMTLIGRQLTALPQSLVRCQKLQVLDLTMSGVTSRPPQALRMPNLARVLMP